MARAVGEDLSLGWEKEKTIAETSNPTPTRNANPNPTSNPNPNPTSNLNPTPTPIVPLPMPLNPLTYLLTLTLTRRRPSRIFSSRCTLGRHLWPAAAAMAAAGRTRRCEAFDLFT